MNITIMTLLKNYSDWIWKFIVLLMLSASLYLNNHYVTKEDYKVDQTEMSQTWREYQKQNQVEHTDISKSLILINQTLVLMNNMTDKISDHETRMRIVEQRQADIMGRIGALDVKVK